MCDQTDIGDGWSIAAAKAPVYGWRAHVFDRATACIKPVPEPLRIPTITSRQIERRPDVGKDLILRMTDYGAEKVVVEIDTAIVQETAKGCAAGEGVASRTHNF